jgi:hypothetical protein
MAKSSRGGLTNYEKQDVLYSQFQRIIRKAEWEERNPHKKELNDVERIIQRSKEDRAKFIAKHGDPALKEEKQISHRISFYNPNNPLNGSSSWSKQKWSEYNAKVKADKKAKQ